MELTNDQLKDIVANIDADIYIARREAETVDSYLRDEGYAGQYTQEQLRTVVNDLATNDPYFVRLAAKA